MTGTVLILGAASGIARAVGRSFAEAGYSIRLAARHSERLTDDAADLQTRFGAVVSLHDFDALALDSHAAFVNSLPDLPDVAICVIGAMGTQDDSQRDPEAASVVIRSNFEGPASILAHLANAMETRGSGAIVGISSVAGERGRASNYVYGSAKAGFTAFLSGLRNRLASKGVHVVTVLPGFVRTAMTDGIDTPAALTAEPKEVGDAILKAVKKRSNVIYCRPIWQAVMAIIRNIPEPIFKKTSL